MNQTEINKKCDEIIDRICDNYPTTIYRFFRERSFGEIKKGVKAPPTKYMLKPERAEDDWTPYIELLLLNNKDLLDNYNNALPKEVIEVSKEDADILKKYKGEGGAQGSYVGVIEIDGKYYASYGDYDCDSDYHDDYYTYKKYNINGRNVLILSTHSCRYNPYHENDYDRYIHEDVDKTIYLD